MAINGTVGIGLVGMWGGELCLKGALPLKGVKTVAVVDTGKGMAAMFMPFKAVHDRVDNVTYYNIDELTHAPVVSFQYWAADGKNMLARAVERVHFANDRVGPSDIPVVRFGPNLIRAKDEWPVACEPSDILQMYLDAWLPEDEVSFISPEERADAMLNWSEDRLQTACPTRIESMGRVFHTRAAFGGYVEFLSGEGIKIADGHQTKWYPRPAGVDYAVNLGREVRHGQSLFKLSTVRAGSPAWTMLADGWRAKMFTTFGKRTYIQARYVFGLPYRCPVCLRDMDKGEKCGEGHDLVLSAPLCPDMWIDFTDRRLNYSGELAEVASFLPDLERCPSVLRHGRARRNAIANRKMKRSRKSGCSTVVDTANM